MRKSTHDANGNMTFFGPQNPTTQVAYDSAGNRVAEYRVDSARAIAQYEYDGLGNRLLARHHFGGGQGPGGHPRDWEISYTWDPNFGLPQLVQEREDGQMMRSYSYGNSRISMDTPAGSYFYSADAMGSVRQLTDASGSVVASYGYSPFGQDRDSFTTPGTPDNPMRFTGEYLDEAASQGQRDLYNLRAREYDAGTGRFLQRDPIDGLGSAYAYVGNRPTVMVDPSGACGILMILLSGFAGCPGDYLGGAATASGAESFECGTTETPATCVVSQQIAHGEYAWTVGDYVFLANDYQEWPESLGGGECLIAHELRHIQQQRQGGGFWSIAYFNTTLNPDDSWETDAYSLGDFCETVGSRSVVDK